MKKVMLFCSIILGLLIITGCGNKKKLDCSQSITALGFKQEVGMYAESEDDELSYFGLKYDMDLSSYGDNELSQINNQDMCSMVKANISDYSDAFINCKQKIENKHLVITGDYDLGLLKSMATEKRTIEDLKVELEKQNFTCVFK